MAAVAEPSALPAQFAPGPQAFIQQAPPLVLFAAPRPAARAAGSSLLVAVLVLLLILVILLLWRAWRGLPRRLARAGWVLYVRADCGFCHKQLALLGGKYPRLVTCGLATAPATGPLSCAQIEAYPTWANQLTGRVLTGLQPLATLNAMAA